MSFPVSSHRSWLAALIAAAAVLRFINLNSDLWLDEVGTAITYLRLPLGEVVRTYNSANQHLFYSVLGSLSFSLFGESAWSARLPAALFGIGGVPALYYLARAVVSRREALLAAAFLAFSYHHVWFSQNARGYSAMVFFSVLGTGFFLRAVAGGERSHWIGWLLSMTAGICSLNNTAFVFIGHLVSWAILRRRYKDVSRPVLGGAAAVILLSVLAHSLVVEQMIHFFRTENRTGLGWFSIRDFAPILYRGLRLGVGAIGLTAGLILISVGWLSFWRINRLASLVMLFPPLINGLALVTLHYGAYPRSFLYMLPFAIMIVVRGAMAAGEWAVERRLLSWNPGTALIIALLVVSAPFVLRNYSHPKQDYTGALAFVEKAKSPGDVVVAVGLAGNVYRRYYAPAILVPDSATQLDALRRDAHSVWVLYSFPRDMRLRFTDLYTYLQANFTPIKVFPGTLSDGEMYLLRANGSARR